MDSNLAAVITSVEAKADRQVSTNVALAPKIDLQMTKANVTRFCISGATGLFADDINGEYTEQGVSRHTGKPFYVRTHMSDGTPIDYAPNKLLQCGLDRCQELDPDLRGQPGHPGWPGYPVPDEPWRSEFVAGKPSVQS